MPRTHLRIIRRQEQHQRRDVLGQNAPVQAPARTDRGKRTATPPTPSPRTCSGVHRAAGGRLASCRPPGRGVDPGPSPG
ncbi:hypothetical protein WR25_10002 [Diploscapter pachys]|uniref:Uncharacterized protein n=1 Tax=Diploscapter pachys TaxID=2018661 RepID=A0A2A2KBV9_9BILA|nr:hypothetical protein WR25_10002 [Diploscapter pachys]